MSRYREARDLGTLTAALSEEFPGFRIVPKSESGLMKAVDVFLKVVTLWRMSTFMNSFHTTVGTTVYTGDSWDGKREDEKMITLRHEAVHMRQARRYGRVLFSILYLFAWLPVGLARKRADFEMEAYEETLRAVGELRGAAAVSRVDRDRMVSHFTSAEYLWAWPFRKSVEAWFDRTVHKVLLELSRSKEKEK